MFASRDLVQNLCGIGRQVKIYECYVQPGCLSVEDGIDHELHLASVKRRRTAKRAQPRLEAHHSKSNLLTKDVVRRHVHDVDGRPNLVPVVALHFGKDAGGRAGCGVRAAGRAATFRAQVRLFQAGASSGDRRGRGEAAGEGGEEHVAFMRVIHFFFGECTDHAGSRAANRVSSDLPFFFSLHSRSLALSRASDIVQRRPHIVPHLLIPLAFADVELQYDIGCISMFAMPRLSFSSNW